MMVQPSDNNEEDEDNKHRPGEYPFRPRQRKFIDPITSYGAISFAVINHGDELEILFLLYQRRDTFEYVDFLRGIWSDEGFLSNYFCNMTEEERQRLKNYTHDELWRDLIVDWESKLFRDGYNRAKRKYELVKDKIHYYIKSTKSCVREQPWGFCKGKRNNIREDPVACALRELGEETRFDVSNVKVWDTKPFFENYRGSNGKVYNTFYYLVEFPQVLEVKRMETPQCIRKDTVSDEVADLKWLRYDEACKKLTPKRQNILKQAHKMIMDAYTT